MVSPIASELEQLVAFDTNRELKSVEKQLAENKIHHFVFKNEKFFSPRDVEGLKELRKKAVALADDHSPTVQKIDELIETHGKALETTRKEVLKNYQRMLKDPDFYDPSQFRYAADELWNNREKGAYAALYEEGVLPAIVYGLYQAGAALAEKQLGKEASYDLLAEGAKVLGEMNAQQIGKVTGTLFRSKMASFIAEHKAAPEALKVAEARLFIDSIAPKIDFFSFKDEVKLKQLQEILTAHGSPSPILEAQIQLLVRERKNILALLPREIQDRIPDHMNTLEDLLQFIEHDPSLQGLGSKQATAILDQLMLTYEGVSSEVTRRLAAIAGMRAKNLNLADYQDLSDAQLIKLLETCPNLEQLDLSNCTHLTSKSLERIGELAPNLKGLSLSGCRNVDDRVLFGLRHLKELGVLNLNGCEQVSDVGMLELRKHQKLYTLSLGNLPLVTDQGIYYLIKLSLKNLSITGCAGITNLENFSKMAHLTTLRLISLPNLDPAGFVALGELPNLKTLSLVGVGGTGFLKECGISYQTAAAQNQNLFRQLEILEVSFNSVSNPVEVQPLYAIQNLKDLYAYELSPSLSRVDLAKLAGTGIGMAIAGNSLVAVTAIVAGALAIDNLRTLNWLQRIQLPPSPRPTLRIHS